MNAYEAALKIPLQTPVLNTYQPHTEHSIVILGMILLTLTVMAIATFRLTKTPRFRLIFRSANSTSKEKQLMQKVSNLVTSFVLSFTGLTAAGTQKAATIAAVSSNANILRVEEVENGKFIVHILNIGQATITVSTTPDTIDATPVTQVFEFEVEDASAEVTHFEMQISDVQATNPVQPAV